MTNDYGGSYRPRGDAHAAYRAQASRHFGAQATASEYENIAVLGDEEIVFASDFTSSPILRHIKTGLVVTKDRVVVRYPQYLFLFIKVGYAESSTPIGKICEVTTGRMLSRRRVTSALLFGFFGLFLLMSGVSSFGGVLGILATLMALVLLAFAAFQAWMARSLGLTVTHAGGGTLHVDVDKLEFEGMVTAGNVIQRLVLAAPSSSADRPTHRDVHGSVNPHPASQSPSAAPSTVVRTTTTPPSTPPPMPNPHNVSSRTPPTIWRG